MSEAIFFHDCWRDEQEKVAILMRQKALLVLNMRIAELVLRERGATHSAAQLRVTLEVIERDDLERQQACNKICEEIRRESAAEVPGGPSGPTSGAQMEAPDGAAKDYTCNRCGRRIPLGHACLCPTLAAAASSRVK